MTHLRAGTAADLPDLARILAANGEPIDWPDLPGWPYLEHLLARAEVVVAEADRGVVGFAGAVLSGRATFLTDLFVDPRHHEHGAGRALLDAVLPGATPRMTFSSADQRALGLYIRAGMRPWWPLLYLDGVLRDDAPAGTGVDILPGSIEETARWSRAWTGVDRVVDFAHYASLPDAAGFVVRDGEAVAAVGWARRHRTQPGRWLDHASIAPDADPVRIGVAIWQAAAAGGPLSAAVPGPHPMVPHLLDHGVRIVDRDQWCASDPDLVDPVRLLPNPGFL